MGYWSWRLLLLGGFFSVWVTGCHIVAETSTSLTATDYPQVTLTVGRFTPPGVEHGAGTAAPEVAALPTPDAFLTMPPDGSLPALRLPAPTCSESASGGTICLGLVENPTDRAVEGVRVFVGLNDAERRLDGTNADVEQVRIAPGGIAPYRALFAAPYREAMAAFALLTAAQPVAGEADEPALEVRDSGSELVNGRIIVSGQIVSADAAPVELLRAVVTLRGSDGRVVGYRVIGLSERVLQPGESLPLRAQIIPLPRLDAAAPVTLVVTVEARRVSR